MFTFGEYVDKDEKNRSYLIKRIRSLCREMERPVALETIRNIERRLRAFSNVQNLETITREIGIY